MNLLLDCCPVGFEQIGVPAKNYPLLLYPVYRPPTGHSGRTAQNNATTMAASFTSPTPHSISANTL